ncbi:hypothetical protein LCGC14_1384770 [marine sediment metagenome]|uniref:Uncharacterized protein n=1 Tax=marine sediment metagenome TaxID=412755 RepID=A0A0F9KMJ2_9ZZZZ
MIFQRVNRTDPERVFIVARNSEGSTLNADDVCAWETAAASVDGVRVRQPDTSHTASIVGVIDAAITDQSYGLVQVYGYRSTSRVFQTNTSQDTGDAMAASLGGAALSSFASTANAPAWFVLAETIASSSASSTISAKMFVRCL